MITTGLLLTTGVGLATTGAGLSTALTGTASTENKTDKAIDILIRDFMKSSSKFI
jgi:hypothetical protein